MRPIDRSHQTKHRCLYHWSSLVVGLLTAGCAAATRPEDVKNAQAEERRIAALCGQPYPRLSQTDNVYKRLSCTVAEYERGGAITELENFDLILATMKRDLEVYRRLFNHTIGGPEAGAALEQIDQEFAEAVAARARRDAPPQDQGS
jgi:hypothetical protein